MGRSSVRNAGTARKRYLRFLVAAIVFALALSILAAQILLPPETTPTPLQNNLGRAIRFTWETARVNDSTRLDLGIIVNQFLSASGEIFDGPGHNDDALVTGQSIFVFSELYKRSGDNKYLSMALQTADRFNPQISNGIVFAQGDDPGLYVDPTDPSYTGPQPGMVFWGFNGSSWLHPSDEQALGAVWGLYNAWNLSQDPRYVSWITTIANYSLTHASSVTGLIIAEIAHSVTGQAEYETAVQQFANQFNQTWTKSVFNQSKNNSVILYPVGYLLIGSYFAALRPLFVPIILRYYLPAITLVLLDPQTAAVYYSRTLLSNGSLEWVGQPGSGDYSRGVEDTRFAMDAVLVLLNAFQGDHSNSTLLQTASRIMSRYATKQLLSPSSDVSSAVVGCLRPFYSDQELATTSYYQWPAANLCSTQATVEFAWAATELIGAEGQSVQALG